MTDLAFLRQHLDRCRADYDHARRRVVEDKAALASLRQRQETLLAAQKLVQQIAERVQTNATQQIASVVTRALAAVFGSSAYRLVIRFDQKRGKTEARLCLERHGLLLEDPLGEAGGGVCDVASFALRCAALVLARPARRRLLVMDEPFRFLSRGHAGRMRELLLALSMELGLQMILVTHNPRLACGKVIDLTDG